MTPLVIFNIHLVLGYVAWLLCFAAYIWPTLRTMNAVGAQRAIATLHSFRFFGLVFILPGVIGGLPEAFDEVAAWGDFVTGVLAMAALASVRARPLFWLFVVAFNIAGVSDLLADYYNAIRLGVPDIAGQFGATYVIPVIYVPILMITHWAAFILLARHARASDERAEAPLASRLSTGAQ